MGRSHVTGGEAAPLSRIGGADNGHADGVVTLGGRCWGTYLHGIFDNDALRHAWLHSLGWQPADAQLFDRQEAYNRLADHVRAHLDMNALAQIVNGE
jgi:adenosylcobyric acid synthase